VCDSVSDCKLILLNFEMCIKWVHSKMIVCPVSVIGYFVCDIYSILFIIFLGGGGACAPIKCIFLMVLGVLFW
jgi:hypothetical protein